ncbi:MAG: CocE/NonD family hydrolase [Anaerolineae bacterium]
MYEVRVDHNVRLTMRDGVELSANLWFPIAPQTDRAFPAILEMIPYRKDDWRYNTDHQHGHYWAQRGYVFCRLDIRGTGSSQGFARDEYTPEETQDGYEVVEWLAAQPWCNGNIGMWGISYGGFTSIQVAKLQPPHLKAIVPMYATDDRYLDDVHYIGGCVTASELAQYAVSMVAMNAMPPKIEYCGQDWADQWKARLDQTPWLIEWLKHQLDGPYWRNGSLAPDYDRITCAIFSIGGWSDDYPNAALRMQAKCVNAPRKALIGNWVHDYPSDAYPGPNLDWLHEMGHFLDYWLKGEDNGVMDEPPLTYFRREYTAPEAFPAKMNGEWISEVRYPIERGEEQAWYLGEQALTPTPSPSLGEGRDWYPHRPTLGTRASLTYGAGCAPAGLARDLRPDEALTLTYTSEPLSEPLDILGLPEAALFLSSSAPIAHVVVRLTDVAPDGTSALVTNGLLNVTHRESHEHPHPSTPGEIYEVRVPMKAIGYRFLPGHRLRLSIASAWWPVIFPSPYVAANYVHRGEAHPSRLVLPVVRAGESAPVPDFKLTPPDLITVGSGTTLEPVWQITEDVMQQRVTVTVFDGDTSVLPDGTALYADERIELTAYHADPAHAQLVNVVNYRLTERGYETVIRASGSTRTTAENFHIDIELQITLNGSPFFQRSWLETIPRQLV